MVLRVGGCRLQGFIVQRESLDYEIVHVIKKGFFPHLKTFFFRAGLVGGNWWEGMGVREVET